MMYAAQNSPSALISSQCSRSINAAWGGEGAFPALETLVLGQNAFSGRLPNWGQNNTAMPSLQRLDLSSNRLSGAQTALDFDLLLCRLSVHAAMHKAPKCHLYATKSFALLSMPTCIHSWPAPLPDS